jgi:LacI family transcriptional regulator
MNADRNRRRNHSATLSDVARHAGVSLATASRVLNGSDRQVGEELRAKVESAAQELRYTPHGPAQAVARGTSRFVALVIGDIADPYFSSIAAGVTKEADRRGLTVAVAATGGDPARETAVVDALRSQRPRALLLARSRTLRSKDDTATRELLAEIARTGAGVAYLGGETSPAADEPLCMVRLGGRSAGGELGRSLVESGYRDFVVLSGPTNHATAVERTKGFTTALRVAGLPAPVRVSSPLTRAGARAAMTSVLEEGRRPECVFAVTDMMAVGAMAALREHGLRPGRDVAVAGFDDIELLQDVEPALTTVALPLTEIGETLLRVALDGEEADVIPGQVRLRESTPTLDGVASRA